MNPTYKFSFVEAKYWYCSNLVYGTICRETILQQASWYSGSDNYFFTIQLMFIEVLLKIKILAYKYKEISGGEVPIHSKENSINKTNIQHPYYLVF